MKLEISQRPPIHAKFNFDQMTWVVRRISSLPLPGFFFVFLFWSLRHAHRSHRWTDSDDLYVIWHLSAQGRAYRAFCRYASLFAPQKNIFGNVKKHFQAKLTKSKNMCIIETTPVPTKFCKTIKTSKCSSRVVQNVHNKSTMADGYHIFKTW